MIEGTNTTDTSQGNDEVNITNGTTTIHSTANTQHIKYNALPTRVTIATPSCALSLFHLDTLVVNSLVFD